MPLKLAEAYVDVSVSRTRLDTGLAAAIAALKKLDDVGTVRLGFDRTRVTSGLNLVRQQIAALKQSAVITVAVRPDTSGATSRAGQGGTIVGTGGGVAGGNPVTRQSQSVISEAVARSASDGMSQGLTRGARAARATGGLAAPVVPDKILDISKLQASGFKLQDRLARDADRAVARAARDAEPKAGQFVGLGSLQASGFKLQNRLADESAEKVSRAADDRAAASARRSRNVGGFVSGASQGLGLTSFALNPAMLAGQLSGGAIRGSINSAIEMETNMATLRRVSGLTVGDMKKFQRTIFDIATSQPGNSPQDVIDIATAGARAGVAEKGGVGSLDEFTRGISRVRGAVQGIETEQLANNLGRLVSLYGQGTDKIEGYGSALVHLDNISKSTASDILEISVGLAGTTANLGGIDPAKLMSLASVLKDVGVSNQLAVSTTDQILRLMGSKPENFAKQLDMPKEDFSAIYNKDALKALDMVSDKFKEINAISPTAGQEWLTELGLRGTRVAGVFQKLSSQLDVVADRTKTARDDAKDLTSLKAAEEITGGTTAAAVGTTEAAVLELKVAAGEAGSSVLKAIAPDAIPVLRATSELFTEGLAKDANRLVKDPNTGRMVPRGDLMVDSDTGKITYSPQDTSTWSGWLGSKLGVRSGRIATDEEIERERILKESNDRNSPAAIRARQLAQVDAERKAAQERADRAAAERRAREEAHPGGLGLPGMGAYYQDLVAAQETEADKSDLVKWGRPGKQGRLNPFQSEQFAGPTGVADFGMGAITDAIVGKKTDETSKEQVERLDDIRTILTEIRDKKDPARTLGTILRGAS